MPLNGDFVLRENFDGSKLAPYWMMLRNPDGQWWRLRKGALEIDAQRTVLGDEGNPSLLARRQQHLNATATTEVRFHPADDGAEAGIVAFQNEEHWYFLAVGSKGGRPVVRVRRRNNDDAAGMVIAEAPFPKPDHPVQLRISAHGASDDFAWSVDGQHWRTLVKDADGTILGTKKAGGFVGAVFGLYAHDGAGK